MGRGQRKLSEAALAHLAALDDLLGDMGSSPQRAGRPTWTLSVPGPPRPPAKQLDEHYKAAHERCYEAAAAHQNAWVLLRWARAANHESEVIARKSEQLRACVPATTAAVSGKAEAWLSRQLLCDSQAVKVLIGDSARARELSRMMELLRDETAAGHPIAKAQREWQFVRERYQEAIVRHLSDGEIGSRWLHRLCGRSYRLEYGNLLALQTTAFWQEYFRRVNDGAPPQSVACQLADEHLAAERKAFAAAEPSVVATVGAPDAR